MIRTDLELEFCMKCGKPNPPEREICECGGRNFVFGNKFTYENKEIVCDCGCKEFRFSSHVNMSPIYNKTYICTGCGNPIGIQTYVPSEFEGDY